MNEVRRNADRPLAAFKAARHIVFMGPRAFAGDTDAATLRVMDEIYARMTPAEKLARVRDLTLTANLFALAGLRERHPGASEVQLLVELARIRLGDELVVAAYGPEALALRDG